MSRGLTVLVGYYASLPSKHILLIDILNLCSLFTVYIPTPFSLLGCNTRLHGVPSAWVFVSGMLAEVRVSPSFLKTP